MAKKISSIENLYKSGIISGHEAFSRIKREIGQELAAKTLNLDECLAVLNNYVYLDRCN